MDIPPTSPSPSTMSSPAGSSPAVASLGDRPPSGSARTELPTGTLTLLFSDIEGSTRLELAVGTKRYAELRERHRALLRASFEANGGIEIGTEGDSFFVVFERPSAAVAAAATAQQALGATSWPDDGRIRVRMGLHTGEVALAGGSYVGTAVNRAARIAAAGHGGQVLVSAATRVLLGEDLPGGLSLRDLGAHRLRDLPNPERLFQLVMPGLASEFPPLRGQVGDALPVQLTSFVGRASELAAAERLLATSRLLTLTGPGGTGKTRLSIALASRAADMFPDGVVFVPLAPIDDAMLVPATIGRALGVADLGGRSALDAVVDFIGDKRVLLVVDNFEQVLSAGPVIAELLQRTPNSTVMLTSRAVLRVTGEQEYEVGGLPAPPDVDRLPAAEAARLPGPLRRCDPDAIGRFEAVILFVARARAVRPEFVLDATNAWAIARITARLGGMPLPIELAAARVKLHDPATILARLDDQLGLLASTARDLPERQRTMRGAIAWSVELLSEAEQTLFDRLGVFVGGFEFRSAANVGADELLDDFAIEDVIASLIDQSLVQRTPGAPGRGSLLEPIREFAVERLAKRGELEDRRDRHAAHFLALAEEAAPHLSSAEQRTWLDRLETERDNLRAAVGWAVDAPRPAIAIRLCFALWRFWQKRGYVDEAAARLTKIVEAPWSREDPRLYARALESLGGIRYWQGQLDRALPSYSEATRIWRDLGDRREIANALYNESFTLGMREASQATPLLEEAASIYRELGDDIGLANVLWAEGSLLLRVPDAPAAQVRLEEARRIFSAAGERTMEAWAEHMLGGALAAAGRLEEARAVFDRALEHFADVGDVGGLSIAFADQAVVAYRAGDLERSARLDIAGRDVGISTGVRLMEASAGEFADVWVATTPAELPSGRYEELQVEVGAWSLDDMLAYARGGSAAGGPTDGPPSGATGVPAAGDPPQPLR